MNQELEKRVSKLEFNNRILLFFCAAMMLVIVIGGSSVSEQNEVIQAQRFELLDEDGNLRAYMGTDENGGTGLFVNDPDERLRLSVAYDSSQSALFIRDKEGTIRIGVAQFAHGGGGVALHGPESKGAAVLYLKGDGSLRFFDEEGNVTSRVPGE